MLESLGTILKEILSIQFPNTIIMWRLLQTNTQTKEIQHTHSATLGQQKNKNAAATFKEIKMIWLFEFI
jgi:hypothetical protein